MSGQVYEAFAKTVDPSGRAQDRPDNKRPIDSVGARVVTGDVPFGSPALASLRSVILGRRVPRMASGVTACKRFGEKCRAKGMPHPACPLHGSEPAVSAQGVGAGVGTRPGRERGAP